MPNMLSACVCVLASWGMTGSVLVNCAAAQTLFVDDDAPSGGDGTSWATAYRFLRDALEGASHAKRGVSEIRMAQGSYFPDRDDLHPNGSGLQSWTFQLINGVTLRGGFAGLAALDPDLHDPDVYQTILSGEIGDPLFAADNSRHVITASNVNETAVIADCVITSGRADGSPAGDGSRGAGALILSSNPNFVRCKFRGNHADADGAGVYVRHAPSTLIMTDCLFENNLAGFMGGGLCFFEANGLELTSCTFQQNHAGLGGGVVFIDAHALTAVDCMFVENEVDGFRYDDLTYNGGGALVFEGRRLLLDRCDFLRNVVDSSEFDGGTGGADISFAGLGEPSRISNCRFIGNMSNSASSGGGARISGFPASSALLNSLFAGNTAGLAGGGVCMCSGGGRQESLIANCTFVANSCSLAGGGLFLPDDKYSIYNCILWNNHSDTTDATQAQLGTDIGRPVVTHCCIEGWTEAGTGVITTDPSFVDQLGADGVAGTMDDNLRLEPGSPCIDAGANSALPSMIVSDLDGMQRFVDDPLVRDTGIGPAPIVDMGAYEFQTPRDSADLNEDGDIDGIDLALLLAAWGACPKGPCPADLDGNGIVNAFDLALLLGA